MSSCTIGLVRFSYLNVLEPRANMQGQLKYSTQILIPKTNRAALAEIEAAVQAAVEKRWGRNPPGSWRHPLRDGDQEYPDREEYRGMMFLNASSTRPPGVVDHALRPIIDPRGFVSGDWGYVHLGFFGYDVSGNRGVGAGLNNLQRTKEGEPLAGKPNPGSVFNAREGDDRDPADRLGAITAEQPW